MTIMSITKIVVLSLLYLTLESLNGLLDLLTHLSVCCGQPDSHFVLMVKSKKGKVTAPGGSVTAYIDGYAPILLSNGDYSEFTVRTSSCEVLDNSSGSCSSCLSYRNTLRAMYSRWKNSKRCTSTTTEVDLGSHTNERYFSTPERMEKMSKLRIKVHQTERHVQKLRDTIKQLSSKESESVDEQLHGDFFWIYESK